MSDAYEQFLSNLEEDEMRVQMIDRMPEADVTPYPTREEWLAARRESLGASDAPILFGLSNYTTPLGLYMAKIGEPEAEAESEAARWGTLLEGVVRSEYARVSGRHVLHIGPHRIHRSRSHPWLSATLDGILPDPERGPGVLEIKTAHRASETDEPAPSYQVQAQQQMLVTGATWGEIVVLYGGQRMVRYPVTANEAFQKILLREAESFWQRVQTRIPPPIDASQASADLLRSLFPTAAPGRKISLPDEAVEWDIQFESAQASIKVLETQRDLAKHHLQQLMGEAEEGILPNGTRYTWRNQTRPARMTPEWTGRVFNRRTTKENGA